MGNWAIIVRGVGAHHNKKHDKDANRMAAKFVQDLRDAGHSILSATMSFSAEDDIGAGAKYNETRDKMEE